MVFELPQELREFYGLEENQQFDTPDDFKKYFNDTFTRNESIYKNENIKKVFTGTAFSVIGRKNKETAKEFGLEYSHGDVEKMTPEDLFKDALSKQKELYEAKLLEVSKSSSEPNEWESKYQKLEKKYKETSDLLANTTNEYNTLKDNSFNELKKFKINVQKNDWFSKIKFKSDLSELERTGFDKYLNDNYSFDVDDNDEFVVIDKKGNKIINDKVAGKFKTPIEILEDEAKKHNLIALNPHSDKNSIKQPSQTVAINNNAQNGSSTNVYGRVAVTKPFGV